MIRHNCLTPAGMTVPFHVPNIHGTRYNPGNPVNSPGEPYAGPQMGFQLVGWPQMVQTFGNLSSNPGIPRMRAAPPVVNRYGPLPFNVMFLGGVLQKT